MLAAEGAFVMPVWPTNDIMSFDVTATLSAPSLGTYHERCMVMEHVARHVEQAHRRIARHGTAGGRLLRTRYKRGEKTRSRRVVKGYDSFVSQRMRQSIRDFRELLHFGRHRQSLARIDN